MGILPPDPGQPLQLAKTCSYDASRESFRRDGETPAWRWLAPSGRAWIATTFQERTISEETYDLLRAGEATREGPFFTVRGRTYALVDDGFEAKAVEV